MTINRISTRFSISNPKDSWLTKPVLLGPKTDYNAVYKMKTVIVLIASLIGLTLGGCAVDRPLISDEDYDRMHGPAPFSPDPTGHIPQPNSRGQYGSSY